jgi:nucleoid-associated protein YgaU
VIFEDSRYENDTIDSVLGSDGAYHSTIFHTAEAVEDIPIASTHVVAMNEDFTTLAWQVFGDPELWWVVADANPQVIYPDEIPVGTVVMIPDVSTLQ